MKSDRWQDCDWLKLIRACRATNQGRVPYDGADDSLPEVKEYVSTYYPNGDARMRDGTVIDMAAAHAEAEILGVFKQLQRERKGGDSNVTVKRSYGADIADLKARGQLGGRASDDELEKQYGWKRWQPTKPQDLDNLDDGGFGPFSKFLSVMRDAKGGNAKAQARMEPWDIRNIETKTQSALVGGTGGFIAPPVYQAQVLQAAFALAPYLALRRIFTAQGGQTIFPMLADRDRSAGDIAGWQLVRVGESSTLADDTINFQTKTFSLMKAAKLCTVPNELLEDSTPGFGQIANDVFAKAVAMTMGEDFFRGVGVTEPLGFLNSAGTYSQAAEAGQDAATILGRNVLKMASRQENYGNSVWIAHGNTMPQLYGMSIQHTTDAGTGYASGHALITNDGGGVDTFPLRLLGRPLYFSEHASSVGTVGDIVNVDPNQYIYLMSASGIAIDISEHVNFSADQVVYRVRIRDSGAPWRDQTVLDARAWEISPFVTLATRA